MLLHFQHSGSKKLSLNAMHIFFYSYLLITCIAHPISMQGLTFHVVRPLMMFLAFHVVAAADDVS
jgi:hypothetical protein